MTKKAKRCTCPPHAAKHHYEQGKRDGIVLGLRRAARWTRRWQPRWWQDVVLCLNAFARKEAKHGK